MHNLDSTTNLDENDIRLFVGQKSDFYLKKWQSYKHSESKIGWNWAAFFGGILWMGYRKMYRYLIVLCCLFVVIDIIQLMVHVEANRTINSITTVMYAMLGNGLYYQHMKNKVFKIKASGMDGETQSTEIAKAGGTTWYGVGIAVLLILAYLAVSWGFTYLIVTLTHL